MFRFTKKINCKGGTQCHLQNENWSSSFYFIPFILDGSICLNECSLVNTRIVYIGAALISVNTVYAFNLRHKIQINMLHQTWFNLICWNLYMFIKSMSAIKYSERLKLLISNKCHENFVDMDKSYMFDNRIF